jgi:DNA-binding CsgD family transcriptional regulator
MGQLIERNVPRRLSTRQVEIVRLIAEGKRSAEIASFLGLSEKTVHNHRQHIALKLGSSNVAVITRWAIRKNLVQA